MFFSSTTIFVTRLEDIRIHVEVLSSVHEVLCQKCLTSERKIMKFFELFVCVMATATIAYASVTVTNLALYGSALSDANMQQCYTSSNLTEADVITVKELKDESYMKAENSERTKKSGCLLLCILRKRGQIVGTEIQKKKLHSKLASAILTLSMQTEISTRINYCVDQANIVPAVQDMCGKTFNLITCIWKDML